MALRHESQHVMPRQETRIHIVPLADIHLARMNAGDRLEIHTIPADDGTVATYFHHIGTSFDGKPGERRVIGRLPDDYTLGDACQWQASVVIPNAPQVRLEPVERQSADNPTVGQWDPQHPDFHRWFCRNCDEQHGMGPCPRATPEHKYDSVGFRSGDEPGRTDDPRKEQERDYQGAC